MKYKRILLKLSGEALMGSKNYGLDPDRLNQYARDIKLVYDLGVEVALVIGGGNIFRGKEANEIGIEKVQGDHMGMLATLINGIALQSAIENQGIYTRLMSAVRMDQIAEPYIRRRAVRHLEKRRVVIFGAGTGNPYFTTDTAAALRATEINADVVIKGTNVDGIYSADPRKDSGATKFETLTFKEVYENRYEVMDLTAFTLCEENNKPIVVFDMNVEGNLHRLITGDQIGTLVNI
jgi:uridylate kinase